MSSKIDSCLSMAKVAPEAVKIPSIVLGLVCEGKYFFSSDRCVAKGVLHRQFYRRLALSPVVTTWVPLRCLKSGAMVAKVLIVASIPALHGGGVEEELHTVAEDLLQR